MTDQNPSDEMALPGTTLRALRHALRAEAGPLPAIRALHAAGSRVGRDALPAVLAPAGAESADQVSQDRFWALLEGYFRRRGWGRLGHRSIHPLVGLLEARDWTESDDSAGETQPTCAFTTGLFSGLLSRVADAPVAVLEVECRSSGAERCGFAFGSSESIHRLYGDLLDGASLDGALSRL